MFKSTKCVKPTVQRISGGTRTDLCFVITMSRQNNEIVMKERVRYKLINGTDLWFMSLVVNIALSVLGTSQIAKLTPG